VTVEVTPEQAEKLGLAIQLGRIKLSLRGTEDLMVPTRGVTPKGILQTDVQIGDDEPYAGGI
jgi:Flp pilus assembly protein CpaB